MKAMEWLAAAFPAAVLAALSAFLPRWGRPGTYFSATVDPAFPASAEGGAIARRYRRDLVAAFAVALGAGAFAWAAGLRGPALVLLPPLVQTVGLGVALARAHVATLPHAIPPSTIRRASLGPVEAPFSGLVAYGPLMILAAAAAVLAAGWSLIPDRFPVQWGLDGQPSRYVERGPFGVMLPLLIAGVCCVFFHLLRRALPHLSRVPAEGGHESTTKVLLATEYLIAILFALAGLSTAFRWPGAPFVVGAAALLGTALLLVFAVKNANRAAVAARGAAADGLPDSAWKWGQFYVNPEDPALLVPKRLGLGYTLNFGRPASWVVLIGFLAFGAAVALLAALAGRS